LLGDTTMAACGMNAVRREVNLIVALVVIREGNHPSVGLAAGTSGENDPAESDDSLPGPVTGIKWDPEVFLHEVAITLGRHWRPRPPRESSRQAPEHR
jgi:hypothetical protein